MNAVNDALARIGAPADRDAGDLRESVARDPRGASRKAGPALSDLGL